MALTLQLARESKFIDHGDPNIVCTRATPWSLFVFFLTNYVAHCATVKSYPAETGAGMAVAVAMALFIPRKVRDTESGNRVSSLPVPEGQYDQDDSVSISAGIEPSDRHNMNWSMCVPEPQIQERRLTTSSFKNFGARIKNIHGTYRLPRGYRFSSVPSDAIVAGVDPNGRVADEEIPARLPWMKQKRRTGIATNSNVSKFLIAIVQTTIAALTLYKSRGDQIQRYGYAAFGLTVVPYIIMGVLNLLAQIATPGYSMLYMVHTPEMAEARQRGGIFDGVVGALLATESLQDLYLARGGQALGDQTFKLDPVETPPGNAPRTSSRAGGSTQHMSFWFGYEFGRPANLVPRGPLPTSYFSSVSFPFRRTSSSQAEPDISYRWWLKLWLWLLQFLLSSISLIVVGCLSGFRSGSESTTAQRVWIITWLIVSMVAGLYADATASLFVPNYDMGGYGLFDIVFESLVGVLLLGGLLIPAVGGFVMVGRMVQDYGICETF